MYKDDGTRLVRSQESADFLMRRRYILWCMEKYRQGFDIKDFAHEPKPKKKIRGWVGRSGVAMSNIDRLE